jgi:hypothetical protein
VHKRHGLQLGVLISQSGHAIREMGGWKQNDTSVSPRFQQRLPCKALQISRARPASQILRHGLFRYRRGARCRFFGVEPILSCGRFGRLSYCHRVSRTVLRRRALHFLSGRNRAKHQEVRGSNGAVFAFKSKKGVPATMRGVIGSGVSQVRSCFPAAFFSGDSCVRWLRGGFEFLGSTRARGAHDVKTFALGGRHV